MKFDLDTMRARFHEAGREKDAIISAVAPTRSHYEQLAEAINALRAEQAQVAAQLRELEAPLVELDRERSFLVKALGGKTGTA